MKIAVGGKGGSGKTTIAGTLARVLAARGQRVVALDDDSNPNLALTVGLPAGSAAGLSALPRDLPGGADGRRGPERLELKVPVEEFIDRYGVPARQPHPAGDGPSRATAARADSAGPTPRFVVCCGDWWRRRPAWQSSTWKPASNT